ncbi:MAG TPA: hypothetical protein VF897_04175, partial [Roseiflexaceae bacterium]
MRPSFRIGLIGAICLLVVLATTGLLELFNSDVSTFTSGPYTPLFGQSGSSRSSVNSALSPDAADTDEGSSGLGNALFDDPTSPAIPTPTATPYFAAADAPFAHVAQLAVEPTLIVPGASSATPPTSPAITPARGATPDHPGATAVGGAPTAPTDLAAPEERGGATRQSGSTQSGAATSTSAGTGSSSPAPTSAPAATAPPVSDAPQPPTSTPKPAPTSTSQPSIITEPTATRVPADTPKPPTSTPKPPTSTP